MKDAKEAITSATRRQYYGHAVPWYMTASLYTEKAITKVARIMQRGRESIVRHTMKEMWPVGSHVSSPHGIGVVIKNTLLFNTYGMGGWIQTDVRYDHAPADAPNKYPHVGHYNQIFLEATNNVDGKEAQK